jgi:ATP-binding cassette subfamily C (CFTR/MRP) protein 4
MVPLHILRSRLGIIPQDPVIFSASVRFNLDPFDQYTDAMIWDSLMSVDMKDHVLSLPGKYLNKLSHNCIHTCMYI